MKECISRDAALAALKKHNKEPFHIQHGLTVEGVMRWYAGQLGYGEDPLNQRSSCGWKATSVAVRLCEEYMVRIESLSPVWSKKVKAN